MPKFEIETPEGRFEVEAPDEQTAIQALQGQMGGEQPAETPATQEGVNPRDFGLGSFGPGFFAPGGRFQAATEATQAGVTGGFDDELTAATNAPFSDRTYGELQAEGDQRKAARRKQFPLTSIAGEVAGGLAVGGTLAKSGGTLIGRTVPGLSQAAPRATQVGLAAAEGGAYGGLYGAGEAKPGERMQGAKTGAAIGAATGGATQWLGNAISTHLAKKAGKAAAPMADDLKDAANQLYRQSEAEGVMLKAPAVKKLGANMRMAAGRLNDKLRPRTAGYVDEIDNMFNGNMTLEQFDEFRQVLGKEISRASPDDARTLMSMKRMVDNFADNLKPGDMTGGMKGVEYLKQARDMWGHAKKSQMIEEILDIADVKGEGNYTQAGLAKAITSKMDSLYQRIVKGKVKGFSPEEVALIRQMAKGGSSSHVINLLSKFAPRGVVSFGMGQFVGSFIPGGQILLPMGGSAAGGMRDRSMLQAAELLRASAAGAPMVGPQITNKTAPFIGGATAGSTEVPRLLR